VKGVIVAAGYGTRFLPVTKTIPKEMLPIINKPAIDFVIDEFISSGINQILIITSRRKKSLEDYLDREVELENALKKEGNEEKLKTITPPQAEFFFIRQKTMKGTGHAILLAETFTGKDPFIVAYPDDIFFTQTPVPRQLIKVYQDTGCSVLGTLYNPPDLHRFGVISIAENGINVKDIVEKPEPGTELSKEASTGRYLFTPDFYDYLREGLKFHKKGEYYHTEGLKLMAKKSRLVYKRLEGERLDIGEPTGYLKAIITYAKMNPVYRKTLKEIGFDIR